MNNKCIRAERMTKLKGKPHIYKSYGYFHYHPNIDISKEQLLMVIKFCIKLNEANK